jgi:hypothetical protein
MESMHKWGKQVTVILPLTAMGKMTTVSNHNLWTFLNRQCEGYPCPWVSSTVTRTTPQFGKGYGIC